MDRYLILLLQNPDDIRPGGSGLTTTATLLAFDLWNHSIQEVELERPLFCFVQESATYTKYKEDQIILFGGRSKKMIRITIESFERTISQ